MGVGSLAGWAGGSLGVRALNAIRLESEGLYPALTLGVCLATFSAAALVGGSGFLAVYVAGILIGRADFVHKRSLIRFHDSLAWLMQIAMFLALGLLVFPSRLPAVALPGLWIALFLLFAARPLGVFLSLARSRLSWRHQLFVAWVGLRGAVPIVLATFPLLARMPQAELYFDIVFFIVLSSTLLQGTTLAWLARQLKLEAAAERRPAFPVEFAEGRRTDSEMWESTLPPGSPAAGRRLVDLGLPKSALVVLISRGESMIVPHGNTPLEAGDTLLVVASRADENRTLEVLGAKRNLEDDDSD
jgi:cell volume regulation protein A